MGMRLVDWLNAERTDGISHGLYYNTQIAMAYNSNHMEGSTLTPEQTAQLYDTGTVLPGSLNERIKADDVIEMSNHFRLLDWMLDHADEPVDQQMVCRMHAILKRGTSQELDPDRNIGGYKVLPNVISAVEGIHTVLPKDVPAAMNLVFQLYADLQDSPYDIAKAHWMFETTHPFSDGNGRVGRMIMFKELLRIDSIPTLILDAKKVFYNRGLRNFASEPGFLVDTLLESRDHYRECFIETLAPNRIAYSYEDAWDRKSYEQLHERDPLRNPFIKSAWTAQDLHQRVDANDAPR